MRRYAQTAVRGLPGGQAGRFDAPNPRSLWFGHSSIPIQYPKSQELVAAPSGLIQERFCFTERLVYPFPLCAISGTVLFTP